MDKDYEVVDGEHGIIREIKEREYTYPRTLFPKSLAESLREIIEEFNNEFSKIIEEYANMTLKDYMTRKKEDEKRARRKQKSKQHKRRTAKRTAHSES